MFATKRADEFATKHSVILLSTLVCLSSAIAPAVAGGDKFTPVEKQLDSARGAQESERFLQAERTLKKVTVAAEKLLSDSAAQSDSSGSAAASPSSSPPPSSTTTAKPVDAASTATSGADKSNSQSSSSSPAAVADDPATRATKLCDEAYCMLGDCSLKLQKYPDAQGAFKRALELEQSKGMPLRAGDKLKELDGVYRAVNIEQALGDKASDVVKEAGIKNAFAVRKGDGESINVELGARYNKKIEQNDPLKAPTDAATASGSGASSGENKNQLKQIRIDPKVSFDFVHKPDGVKLTNIQGLSADVGLWVKLMEVELLKGAQGLPKARVTAGKMGIQKTVDLDVPDKVYDQVRSGIEKLDPFFNLVRSVIQGAPAVAAPVQDSPPANPSGGPPPAPLAAPASPVPPVPLESSGQNSEPVPD